MTRLGNDPVQPGAAATPRPRLRRLVVFVGFVGFVAALFTLVNGNAVLEAAFDGDEVQQVEFLSGVPRPELGMSRWSLWSFFEGTEAELETLRRWVFEGDEAWCTVVDEPRPKMKFFRPLSSLSLALDYDLFGQRPFGYHLQQLLWYFAVLAALAAVLRRAFLEEGANTAAFPPLAAAALLVFAFDATHGEAIGRVATRHLLMSTFFGLTAVYGHMVARERRSLGAGALSLIALVLGLLSSENVLQVVPFFLMYEIWRDADPWSRRLRALIPVGFVSALYCGAYYVAGYGAKGNGYLDPFGTPPGLLLAELPVRFFDLVCEELLGLPGLVSRHATPWSLTGLDWPPAGRIALGLSLVVAFVYLTLLATRGQTQTARTAVRWLSAAGAAALLPALFGQLGPRLLFVPSIGAAVVFVAVIQAAWRALRAHDTKWVGRFGWATVGLAVIASHVVLAPLGLRSNLRTLSAVTQSFHERWLPPPPVDGAPGNEVAPPFGITDILVIAAPSTSVPKRLFPEFERVVLGDGVFPRTEGQRWWFLSNNTVDFEHHFKRTGAKRFELRLGSPKLDPPAVRSLWMGCDALPGLEVETRSLRITVLETEHGGAITRIQVELTPRVDAGSVLIVSWSGGALKAIRLPPLAPAGQGRVEDRREPRTAVRPRGVRSLGHM